VLCAAVCCVLCAVCCVLCAAFILRSHNRTSIEGGMKVDQMIRLSSDVRSKLHL
jgi:hypothetical protein